MTGAFGYSGKYIAHRLLADSRKVITLTNSPHRENPFGDSIHAYPFNFDKPDLLEAALKGVKVIYNTYWVRFNHRLFTYADAVENTKILFNAARQAGVERIQPIYVDDLAALAVQQGKEKDHVTIDAIGPETFTYRKIIKEIGRIIEKNRPVISMPPFLGYCIAWITGKIVNDVIITKDEIQGLMANLLFVDSPPAGTTTLTGWANRHADTLGFKYTSELARRKKRTKRYESN